MSLKDMFAYLRRNKGEEMPDSTPPTSEDLLRAHIATLQHCDIALGRCIESACQMLEQVRVPHAPSEPPIEVPSIKVESDGGMTAWRPDPGPAMPGAAIELPPSVLAPPEELQGTDNAAERVAPSIGQAVSDPTEFREGVFAEAANPPQGDPRTPVVDFGALPEGTHPIPQGVRYEGDTPFNSGHTAVIKYE